MILIDSGNTRCFIDLKLVQAVKLPHTSVKPIPVTVADGRQMEVKARCSGCEWTMNSQKFQFDLRLLELGYYDLILRTDWMRKHSPVTFDYEKNKLLIHRGAKKVELQGATEEVTLKLVTLKSLNKLVSKAWKGVHSTLLTMS